MAPRAQLEEVDVNRDRPTYASASRTVALTRNVLQQRLIALVASITKY